MTFLSLFCTAYLMEKRMDHLIGQLVLQLVLIALNAFFACAEIAGLSVNDAKIEQLKEKGDKRARSLEKLKSNSSRFLATIQVAITLSGFLGSAFAADNFSSVIQGCLEGIFPSADPALLDSVSVIGITLMLSYVTLVFGELVPKRLAMKKSEQIALGIAGIICFVAAVFRPVVWFLEISTNIVLRLIGIDPNSVDEQVSEDDIKLMVDEGSKTGAIDTEEKEIIHNLFEFNDRTVGEFSTHRTELDVLWLDDDIEEWEHTILEHGRSAYPVCNDTVDEICGILSTKKFFKARSEDKAVIIEKAVEDAFFIPDTMKADVAFRQMKQKGRSVAIVLDEYGGVFGILTIKDIIAQIVGDFETDEDGDGTPDIQQLSDTEYIIQGITSLDKIEALVDTELPTDEYDTFGGFVFSLWGSIPDDGTEIECDYEHIHIKSLEIDSHRLVSAHLTINNKADEQEE